MLVMLKLMYDICECLIYHAICLYGRLRLMFEYYNSPDTRKEMMRAAAMSEHKTRIGGASMQLIRRY